MIGIIDYGAGNLGSVKKAFAYLDVPHRIIASANELNDVSGLVLPGVGAFGAAIEKLKTNGFFTGLQLYIKDNRPFLGICLGMQLLMEESEESKGIKGLGLIKGTCRRFREGKIPHMGWNRVYHKNQGPLFKSIPEGSFFYFIHSYYVQEREQESDQWTAAVTSYTTSFTSVFESGNVCAVQFHPEKSGEIGLKLLKNWTQRCKTPLIKSFCGGSRGAVFSKSAPLVTTRIIPCLDIDNGRVVKGVQFGNIRDAGDPMELAALYNRQGADEITFLDIGATYKSREILLEVLERVSRRVFVPLSVGGGIRSIDDMRKVLHAGADKVSICSAALKNPLLLSEGARIFGSQCIVLSIDAKKVGNTWHAFLNGGRNDSGKDAIEWARQAEELGAGEILLNSIDRDGTQVGYDLELTRRISELVNLPVIASGGAGTMDHMKEVIIKGKADAVLLASLLHDRQLALPDIKAYLNEKGVKIR
jgi:imidazole glycerol phosphate synthase glutamine amidotransferase subunit